MTEGGPDQIPAIMRGARCGAKTRSGKPCQAPAANGYRRCRMHGGAPGSGAPKGNKNAVRHGFYTKEAKGLRKQTRDLLHASFILADAIDRKPSERMQFWASRYVLENTPGSIFSKVEQEPPFSEEEQDKVALLFRKIMPFLQKRENAKRRSRKKAPKARRSPP